MGLEAEAIARLLVALGLGAAIGAEREVNDQPAGLRTHIAVCIGAALFGVISTMGFSEFDRLRSETNVQVDVTRVASQVVVGIGFLGAGVIFRQGLIVRNLTTAASLWVTAAIGLACGVGDVGTAAVACGLMLLALAALLPLRNWLRRHFARDERRVRIRLVDGAPASAVVTALQQLEGVRSDVVAIDKDDGAYVVVADLLADRMVHLGQTLATITTRDDVRTLSDAD